MECERKRLELLQERQKHGLQWNYEEERGDTWFQWLYNDTKYLNARSASLNEITNAIKERNETIANSMGGDATRTFNPNVKDLKQAKEQLQYMKPVKNAETFLEIEARPAILTRGQIVRITGNIQPDECSHFEMPREISVPAAMPAEFTPKEILRPREEPVIHETPLQDGMSPFVPVFNDNKISKENDTILLRNKTIHNFNETISNRNATVSGAEKDESMEHLKDLERPPGLNLTLNALDGKKYPESERIYVLQAAAQQRAMNKVAQMAQEYVPPPEAVEEELDRVHCVPQEFLCKIGLMNCEDNCMSAGWIWTPEEEPVWPDPKDKMYNATTVENWKPNPHLGKCDPPECEGIPPCDPPCVDSDGGHRSNSQEEEGEGSAALDENGESANQKAAKKVLPPCANIIPPFLCILWSNVGFCKTVTITMQCKAVCCPRERRTFPEHCECTDGARFKESNPIMKENRHFRSGLKQVGSHFGSNSKEVDPPLSFADADQNKEWKEKMYKKALSTFQLQSKNLKNLERFSTVKTILDKEKNEINWSTEKGEESRKRIEKLRDSVEPSISDKNLDEKVYLTESKVASDTLKQLVAIDAFGKDEVQNLFRKEAENIVDVGDDKPLDENKTLVSKESPIEYIRARIITSRKEAQKRREKMEKDLDAKIANKLGEMRASSSTTTTTANTSEMIDESVKNRAAPKDKIPPIFTKGFAFGEYKAAKMFCERNYMRLCDKDDLLAAHIAGYRHCSSFGWFDFPDKSVRIGHLGAKAKGGRDVKLCNTCGKYLDDECLGGLLISTKRPSPMGAFCCGGKRSTAKPPVDCKNEAHRKHTECSIDPECCWYQPPERALDLGEEARCEQQGNCYLTKPPPPYCFIAAGSRNGYPVASPGTALKKTEDFKHKSKTLGTCKKECDANLACESFIWCDGDEELGKKRHDVSLTANGGCYLKDKILLAGAKLVTKKVRNCRTYYRTTNCPWTSEDIYDNTTVPEESSSKKLPNEVAKEKSEPSEPGEGKEGVEAAGEKEKAEERDEEGDSKGDEELLGDLFIDPLAEPNAKEEIKKEDDLCVKLTRVGEKVKESSSVKADGIEVNLENRSNARLALKHLHLARTGCQTVRCLVLVDKCIAKKMKETAEEISV
eukprot:g6307.t1